MNQIETEMIALLRTISSLIFFIKEKKITDINILANILNKVGSAGVNSMIRAGADPVEMIKTGVRLGPDIDAVLNQFINGEVKPINARA